ncbi:MAG: hypothetical protein GC206_13415 [Alphaproteobacteria bacterium]|nr:hypothetical protein [Alphaproteobacteria bacterium]
MQNKQAKEIAKHTVLLGAAARDADAESAAFSTREHEVNEIELDMGVGGITFTSTDKIEFELSKSADDTEGGSYAAYTGQVLLHDVNAGTISTVTCDSNGVAKAFVAAHAAARRYVVTILEPGWYKAKLEYGGTHGAATPNAVSLRQHAGRMNPSLGTTFA